MMVGFIAIATFNGFNVVDRTSTDQRKHDQAVVLAAQSQEQLRSDSSETLDLLQSAAHSYTQTIRNQVYTVSQAAKWVNDNNQAVPCSATGKESNSNQNGDYLRITSSVTWPQLLAAKRPAVSQTSIITPPDGSALEVDVTNGLTPLQPVAGVTAIANSVQNVTGETGCVIFGAIPATKVNVEVYKLGDVTHSGAFKKVAKELLIAPNLTTHYPVTLAPGGSVTAQYTYKGLTTYEGKLVTGDAFVVSNNNIGEVPYFEVGATKFGYEKSGEAEGEYSAVPGKPGEYATTSSTPINPEHYPTGDLFPFENAWLVYPGDCPANEPAKFKGENTSVNVKAGEVATVHVPTSFVKLTLYEGTQQEHKAVVSSLKEKDEVKITDVSCAAESAVAPNNSAATVTQSATQYFTEAGALEAPFQPFGKYELCLYSAAAKKTYTVAYANETVEGSRPNIYLLEKSGKEKQAQREKTEEEAKSKRETEEKEAKAKRETEEKEAKSKREAEEKAKGKTPIKETAEEKTAKTKRINEEKAAKTKSESEEKEKRELLEAKEEEELASKEVQVESEKKSC